MKLFRVLLFVCINKQMLSIACSLLLILASSSLKGFFYCAKALVSEVGYAFSAT